MCIVKGYLVSEPLLSEPHRRLRLVVINKDLLEPEVAQVGSSLLDVLEVLRNDRPGGPLENEINLLKSLALGLRHEQQLVEPAEKCNAAEEAHAQTLLGHGILHATEVVGDDE